MAETLTHRRVLRIAVPIVISNATIPILGVVDTSVVGRIGEAAPIGDHLAPIIEEHGLSDCLHTIYENSMGGALRYRARAGDGVAWLPQSLVQPDLDSGVLVRTGRPEWAVDMFIHLLRDETQSNHTTRSIWSFLEKEGPLKVESHAY